MRYLLILVLLSGACDEIVEQVPDASPPPDAALVHNVFPTLCDAMTQVVARDCQWDVDCHFLEPTELQTCIDAYFTYLWWRCSDTPPPRDDSAYLTCLADFNALPCVLNTIPMSCDGIW